MKDLRFPNEQIFAILEKYQLGKIQSIRYASTGMVNPILFFDKKYVLKINVRDPDIPKLRREAVVMKKLLEVKLPVPELLVLDEDKDVLPYDFIIMGFLEGKEIHANWKNIKPSLKEKLCFEGGVLLSKIHQIDFPKFGDLQNGIGEYDTWIEYIFCRLNREMKSCFDAQLFSKMQLQQMENIFSEKKEILESVVEAKLVHADFHLGNLLFQEKEISGILDFEWSLAGDPEWDLKDFFTFEGSSQPFMEGYQSQRTLSNFFNEKIDLYNLLGNLELTYVADQHWGKESMEWFRKKVLKGIEKD